MLGGFDEGEMKSSRQQDKDKSEKQSIDHNVTPDRERNVEPAAESRRNCEAGVESAVAGRYGNRR